jgi:hypothetical protein
MALLDKKAKPQRQERKPNGEYKQRKPLPQKWWIHAEKRPALYAAMQQHRGALVTSCIGNSLAFCKLPRDIVYSHKLIVFPFESYSLLCLLQSHVHEEWARSFTSTNLDLLNYSPSDCFETLPFPVAFLDSITNDPAHAATRQSLETIGERYHQYRAELMVRNNEGLTSTYNRFHDPAETTPDHLELRCLHGEMDQAVLAAYGWSDGFAACGFGLDYLDTEEDAHLPDELQERIDSGELFFWDAGDALDFQGQLKAYGAITGRRKLPWRYRWPDAVRDDVLARLLALNIERYEKEQAMGQQDKGIKSRSSVLEVKKRFGQASGSDRTAELKQIGLEL